MLYRRYFYNRALRILVITNAIILLAAAMVAPIYAIFVEQIGGDIMEAGIAGTIFAFVAGVTTLFSGKLADKSKNRQNIVAFGYLLMAIGFFLYIYVDSVWFLFAVQALIGLGEAVYSPAFDGLYTENTSHTKESSQWSLWESMNYFSIALGAIVGALVADVFGFKTLFIVIALFCLVSAIYLFFLPKRILKKY